MIDSVLGGGVHKHSHLRYCTSCGRKINELNGEVVVVFPKFNTREPPFQNIPQFTKPKK